MRKRAQSEIVPIGAMLLAVAAITFGLWSSLNDQRRERIAELVVTEADHSLSILGRDLVARVAVAEQMAEVWAAGSALDPSAFSAIARPFIADFPGLRAMKFAGADGALHSMQAFAASAPVSARDAAAWLDTVARDPLVRAARVQATTSLQSTLSPPLRSADGARVDFIAFVPLAREGSFLGMLHLVFDAEIWLSHLLFAQDPRDFLPDFSYGLRIHGLALWQTSDFDGDRDDGRIALEASLGKVAQMTGAQAAAARVLGADLELVVQPRASFLHRHWSWLPEAVAGLAVLISSGIMLLAGLANRAHAAEMRGIAANRHLSQVVADQRREVASRKEAEAKALVAQEATARFLATISHEVRTPLNAIMGMFELITSAAEVPDRHRRQARAGLESAERLHRELSNVLDASRLDAQAMPIQLSASPLQPHLGAWSAALSGLVKRSGKPITARLDVGGGLPGTALIDAQRVTQVITNLLDNAIKFTDRGEVALRVLWQPLESAAQGDLAGPSDSAGGAPDARHGRLVIEVEDTGPGIPADRRESVFNRFYQVQTGPMRSFAGSGLGLSISRDLARLMQGDLTTEAAASGGSVFRLTIPAPAPQGHRHEVERPWHKELASLASGPFSNRPPVMPPLRQSMSQTPDRRTGWADFHDAGPGTPGPMDHPEAANDGALPFTVARARQVFARAAADDGPETGPGTGPDTGPEKGPEKGPAGIEPGPDQAPGTGTEPPGTAGRADNAARTDRTAQQEPQRHGASHNKG